MQQHLVLHVCQCLDRCGRRHVSGRPLDMALQVLVGRDRRHRQRVQRARLFLHQARTIVRTADHGPGQGACVRIACPRLQNKTKTRTFT